MGYLKIINWKPNEIFSTRIGLPKNNLVAIKVPWEPLTPLTTQAIAKATVCFPQTVSETLSPKTTPT